MIIKNIPRNPEEPIELNDDILDRVFKMSKSGCRQVIGIVLATKPCFYKLWSLAEEFHKKNLPYILINTGQHYDEFLGHGLKEFNFIKNIAINLNIRGDLCQKSAELFTKLKFVSTWLNKRHPGVDLIPYVNGDTLAAGVVPLAWLFATNLKSIQGEAGLRSMSPASFIKLKATNDFQDFVNQQFQGDWIRNKTEPFPEQIDTTVSALGSEFFLAPVKLNADHLTTEGHKQDKIFITGNTVVDVIKHKQKSKPEQSVFDVYPTLENGEWLRVDIHRRGNLTEKRFKAIIGGVTSLVKDGKKVVFVELTATRRALEHFGLRDQLMKLDKANTNFLFTPLWKEYSHVMEFVSSDHCWAIFTDSGSIQEEMNELQKPCITARFNTDRPETVMQANSNLLAPPLSANFVANTVNQVFRYYREDMTNRKRIYGTNVAGEITKKLKIILENRENFFSWAHEHLDIYKEPVTRFKYL